MNAAEFQYAVQTLGWTLVHFLWQGAALGLVYALTMVFTDGQSPRLRYRLGLAIFLLAGALPVFTFIYLFQPAGPVTALGTFSVTASSGTAEPGAWWVGLESWLEPYLPWAVAMWLAGVAVMSSRVCVDWWQVRRLTRMGVSPLPRNWEHTVAALLAAFRVSRPVRVLRSQVVRVPAVIGWLRPVVLLPSAAIIGLSPRQLELIIAHELAHIRRSDYLVNLIQVLIETLLFYHPAVRWMSNRLREEREHCCDDAVIATCGDTLTYAHALTELEEQRQASYQTALAANGGVLSQRIYRMLDRSTPRRSALIWGVSLLVGLAAGSMAVAAQLALNAANPAPSIKSSESVTVPPPPLATVESGMRTPAPAPAEQAPSRPEAAGARNEDAGRTEEPPAARADSPEPVTRAESGSGPTSEPSSGQSAATSNVAAQPAEATDQPARQTPEPASNEAPRQNLAMADAPKQQRPAVDSPEPAKVAAEEEKTAPSPGGATDAIERPSQASADSTSGDQPTRLASASPAESIASRPPEPRIEGGRPLKVVAPDYPRFARLRGIQGSVTAEFTIDRQGRVTDVRVVDSSPAGVFNRSVTDALEDWRFQPLLKDGKPTARRVAKVFEFNLDGGRGKSSSKTADGDGDCDPLTGTRICRPWSRSDILEEARLN